VSRRPVCCCSTSSDPGKPRRAADREEAARMLAARALAKAGAFLRTRRSWSSSWRAHRSRRGTRVCRIWATRTFGQRSSRCAAAWRASRNWRGGAARRPRSRDRGAAAPGRPASARGIRAGAASFAERAQVRINYARGQSPWVSAKLQEFSGMENRRGSRRRGAAGGAPARAEQPARANDHRPGGLLATPVPRTAKATQPALPRHKWP